MFALLQQEWRARRVAVLYADQFPGHWACALLHALGAQVVAIPGDTPLDAETLCHLLSKRRPCMLKIGRAHV